MAQVQSHTNKTKDRRFKSQFRKTEMCKFFLAGRCTKGRGCVFAHGEAQLRVAPELRKTSMCAAWIRGGCDLTSEQCEFAHGRDELRRTNQYVKKLESMPDLVAKSTLNSSSSEQLPPSNFHTELPEGKTKLMNVAAMRHSDFDISAVSMEYQAKQTMQVSATMTDNVTYHEGLQPPEGCDHVMWSVENTTNMAMGNIQNESVTSADLINNCADAMDRHLWQLGGPKQLPEGNTKLMNVAAMRHSDFDISAVPMEYQAKQTMQVCATMTDNFTYQEGLQPPEGCDHVIWSVENTTNMAMGNVQNESVTSADLINNCADAKDRHLWQLGGAKQLPEGNTKLMNVAAMRHSHFDISAIPIEYQAKQTMQVCATMTDNFTYQEGLQPPEVFQGMIMVPLVPAATIVIVPVFSCPQLSGHDSPELWPTCIV